MKNFFLVLVLLFPILLFAKNVSSGLRLSDIKQNSVFYRLGLRNGDIIIKVDGSTATSVESLNNLLSGKKNGDTINLLIKRKGKEETLHYTIK